MAFVKLNGDTSGYTIIAAPAISNNNTLTLPTVTDTLVTQNGATLNNAIINNATLNSPTWTYATLTNATLANPMLTNPQFNTATNFTTVSAAPINGEFLPAANTLAFATNNSERLRITSGGNLLIGTTTDSLARITVQRSAGANYIGEMYGSDGTQWWMINSNAGGGSYNPLSTAGDHALIYTNGTVDTGSLLIAPWSNSNKGIKILSTGNVGIATTSAPLTLTVSGDIAATRNVYSNYSDLRLKNKIGDITAAVDKVKHIDTLYYEPNELAQSLGSSTGRHIGVTAQSVQSVVPESIGPSPLDTRYMTVQYERLVPLLIEAIKELEARIALLEQRET
jgi:hypothetical protein